MDDSDEDGAAGEDWVPVLLTSDTPLSLAYPDFEDTMVRYNTFQGDNVPLRDLPGVLKCVDAGLFWPPLDLLPGEPSMVCHICGARVTGPPNDDPAGFHRCTAGVSSRRRYVLASSTFLRGKKQSGTTPRAPAKVRHWLLCVQFVRLTRYFKS
jgi:hypothetical protein